MKKVNSKQNLHFLQLQIQNIKLFKNYTEKDKPEFGQNCHSLDRNLPLNLAYILWT